mmetsp:Transcript_53163/g.112979  ORF Transcript_53163/g.112979 Transcript_53163/m.112979 type:complete len:221 (-) Transcript_53163:536-1198(-)
MVERTLYARHLRPVALLGRSTGRIGIDLCRRSVRRIGHAGAESQALLARNGNDALLTQGFADYLAVGVGGSDVRYFPHRLDHRREPLGRGTRLVLHEVEPVRDLPFLAVVHDAIPRELGGPELRLVRVGRLVQVQVARPFLDVAHVLPQETDQRRGLVRGSLGVERPSLHNLAVGVERTVRVGALGRPPLDPLVPPWADAWGHEDVEVPRVVRRPPARQE